MSAFASQNDRESGSPGTRANDGDLAHPRLQWKWGSVPAWSRRMLPRCLAMIRAEAAAMKTSTIGVFPYAFRSQASSGKIATVTIEAKEIYLKANTITT